MDKDRIEGKGRQIKGKIKDAFGGATDDGSLQAKGKVDKVVGKVQEGFGKVKDEIRASNRQADMKGRDAL